jgi:hypothetical protein
MAQDQYDFKYGFRNRFPGLTDDVAMALQRNFRDGATEAYVQNQAGLLVPKSAFDANGDLLAGTGDNTYTRIAPPGVNYRPLISDATVSGGLKYEQDAIVSCIRNGLMNFSLNTWNIVTGFTLHAQTLASVCWFDSTNNLLRFDRTGTYKFSAAAEFPTPGVNAVYCMRLVNQAGTSLTSAGGSALTNPQGVPHSCATPEIEHSIPAGGWVRMEVYYGAISGAAGNHNVGGVLTAYDTTMRAEFIRS